MALQGTPPRRTSSVSENEAPRPVISMRVPPATLPRVGSSAKES
jgi:hypothetical protein